MKALVRTFCFTAGIVGMTGTAYATHHYFYANCLHESHGFIGYNGRRHADAAEAQKDCATHLKTFPRHRCRVLPIDY